MGGLLTSGQDGTNTALDLLAAPASPSYLPARRALSGAARTAAQTAAEATKPYTDFFYQSMEIPSKLITPRIEQLRPMLTTTLGEGVGNQVTDSLKLAGGIGAVPWLMPEAEAGEVGKAVSEAGEARPALRTAERGGGMRAAAVGAGAAGAAPPPSEFGAAAHEAHLAQDVARLGAEKEDEPRRKLRRGIINPESPTYWPDMYHQQQQSLQQLLQGLGGTLQGLGGTQIARGNDNGR